MIRGPQRIDAINTLEYWGTGLTYNLGQAYRPDAPWPALKYLSRQFELRCSGDARGLSRDRIRTGLCRAARASAGSAAAADSGGERFVRLE